MTNEETLDWLCRLRSWLVSIGVPKEWRPKFSQALSNAIKVLEQDPVSRQAVLDKISVSPNSFYTEIDQEFFANKIRLLPPVTPQAESSEAIHGNTYGGVSWGGTYKQQLSEEKE